MIPCPKRVAFLTTYHRYQLWSLPDSIIYYITKKPSSSKCYEKLIQSCKDFFIQNPLLIIPNINFIQGSNGWLVWYNVTRFDIRKLLSKIWITDRLHYNNYKLTLQSFLSSSFIPKIYQSDIKSLTFIKQNISLREFQFIASKCKDLFLRTVTIVNEDNSVVALEKIIEVLYNVETFHYDFTDTLLNVITFKTVKELIKIPHFLSLTYVVLYHIPQNFDIDSFYDYIKVNKKSKIYLSFCDQISQEYKFCLQAIVDEIVAAENRVFKAPFIWFSGNDESSYQKLKDLYYQR